MPYNGGDILAVQKEGERPFFIDQQILAANAGPFNNVVVVRGPNHQIMLQKIVWSIATHAAQTITFQDDAGTPVKVAAHTDAAAGAGVPSVVTWDFGPHGIALTPGTNLDITLSGAGSEGRVHLEGYQRLALVIFENATPNTEN